MPTRLDSRQTQYAGSLAQLSPNANPQLDALLQSINSGLTPPLKITVSGLVVTINSIANANPITSVNTTIPPISNVAPAFTSATITFPASSGGTVTVSPGTSTTLTLATGKYIKASFNLDASGNINISFGTAGASISAATVPPSITNTYAIGYVVLQNISGTIQNLTAGSIYQYVGAGSGSGGGGSGNPLLETLKNEFVDSPYQLLTPNIIATDGQTKFASLSGAAYDLVSNTIKFTANAQVATSTNLLDLAEFSSQGVDIGSIDLSAFWNLGSTLQALSVPSSFVYEVSRDGGTNWFTAAMSQVGTTNTFAGSLRFDTATTTEATKQTIVTQAVQDSSFDTGQYQVGTPFTLTATTKIQDVILQLKRGTAVPSGSFTLNIIKDSSGSPGTPSTASVDVLSQSAPVSISSLSLTTTLQSFTLSLAPLTLVAGTYHLVLIQDASYIAGFNSNNSATIFVGTKASGVSPFLETRSSAGGNVWVQASPQQLTWTLRGRALDLRVRLTSAGSPTYPCGLDGFGVFYGPQTVGAQGYQKKTQRFTFNSVTDNLSSFAITAFTPDPDLLTCYWVEGGQSFKSPAFTLQGQTAVFPTNTFNQAGVSQVITLIFDQNTGGAYDNSDVNANLLANNHLGSTSGVYDKSAAGRGIFLRRPDGTLREITIDNNDNISILSVP